MSSQTSGQSGEESREIARLLSYILLFVTSGGLFWEATTIPTSRFEVLGASAFPMLVHGCLTLLLFGAMASSLRRIPTSAFGQFASDFVFWIKTRWLVFVLLICFGLYIALMPVIGYPITTFVFLTVLQSFFGPKTKNAAMTGLIVAILFSFGLNWLFDSVFNVFLPRGIL